MNTNSLVSIIVPCYNQEKYIAETLDSILKQTYTNWECIIVDDGSTDSSKEVICEIIKNDSRFKIVEKKNEGVAIARNIGINAAKGEYILPLDADDIISKEYLSCALGIFLKMPETKLVYPNVELIGTAKGKWNLPDYQYKELLLFNMIICSAIFKKVDFNKTNGYDSQFIYGLEDWDFWISFLNPNDYVYKLDDIHFFYRIKKVSRNANMKDEQIADASLKIYIKHIDKYKKIFGNNFNNPIQLIHNYTNLKREYELTINSLSYIIGRAITKPFRIIQKNLRRYT